uniref:CSON003834 protein n=1 Tax=Culicoides sonorensis TaxID=179676 RepID=A0A336LDJ0_CULSO
MNSVTIPWNVRKFHELPYQSYFIDCDHYHKSLYLTDLSWISSKLICLGVCSFIEDAMICNKNKDALHVEILCQIVSKNFTSLNYDGEQFYSHVRQFIESNQDFESLSVLPEVKQKWIAFIRIERLWLKPKNMLTMNDKVETYSYDIALSLNCKGNYIALLSKAGQEICVWDIERDANQKY